MATPYYKTYHPKYRKQWLQWLQKNHIISPGIRIIYLKKSGKPGFGYGEDQNEQQHFNIECGKWWTFYLAKLKSIHEGGQYLRNKNTGLKKVINA